MQSVRRTIGGLGNLMFKQAYLIGKTLDGEIPDVYVQGESFWKKHAEQVKSQFSVGIGKPIEAVALHIRRGDYLQAHDFHVNLWETDYYKKAISLFPNQRFIIFCKDNQGWEQDKADREWCRLNVAPLIEAVGGTYELPDRYNSEIEDFNLMASCQTIIMANSTFSWWAAYVGTHDMVVTPEHWFVDGIQRTELLNSWTKI